MSNTATAERTATVERTVLDNDLMAELDAIGKSVIDNYTLADALRASKVQQVREAWDEGEGTGCALTAIYTEAFAHNVTV